jgi:hypothetical protein
VSSKKKPKADTQFELIDVLPAKAKPIIKAARIYKEYQTERLQALVKEKNQKAKVLALVKDAKLKALAGGVIKFTCDGITISITPRDELVQVEEE